MPSNLTSRLLSHPLTRGLSIDDPRTTALRRRIVNEKPFLKKIYIEWYQSVAAALPPGPGRVLELGSGPGFLDQFIDGLITSEIFPCPGVAVVLDGHRLPFDNVTLRAIVMIDVLHHLPRPREFLAEAARCVRPGGAIVMIEPWASPWSGWIYRRLHNEPFEPASATWEFPASGPLSGANMAMPWMIFHRDREQFEREFPQWRIADIRPMMPIRYILSGGVTLRSLMPGFAFGFWRTFESLLDPWRDRLAMFAQIQLVRTDHSSCPK
jgi:SAM-dependent methyltransferase